LVLLETCNFEGTHILVHVIDSDGRYPDLFVNPPFIQNYR